jgi:hypothetical protein
MNLLPTPRSTLDLETAFGHVRVYEFGAASADGAAIPVVRRCPNASPVLSSEDCACPCTPPSPAAASCTGSPRRRRRGTEIPDPTVELWPDATHSLPMEETAELEVLAFMASHDG